MPTPVWIRSIDKVVDAESGIQFGVQRFDGSALKREVHDRGSLRGRREIDQEEIPMRVPTQIALAQQPYFGFDRPAAPADDAPDGSRRGKDLHLPRGDNGGHPGVGPLRPPEWPGAFGQRDEGRSIDKHSHGLRNVDGVGRPQEVQRPANRGAVPKCGIGGHGRYLDMCGSHLLQQRMRLARFLFEMHSRRNGPTAVQPNPQQGHGQVQMFPDQPSLRAHPWRGRDRQLAIAELAEDARLPARQLQLRIALSEKPGAVGRQSLRQHRRLRAQFPQHAVEIPQFLGDEMRRRLICVPFAQPIPHDRHQLPATVAQDLSDVESKAAPCGAMTGHGLEPFEPCCQSCQPRARRDNRYRVRA